MSQNIWKTLEKAKKRQEQIRDRIRSIDSDDEAFGDDDPDEYNHTKASNRTTNSNSSSAGGGGDGKLTIDEQQQEQAPEKKAPPPVLDDRPIGYDEDSEPDYYGYLFEDDYDEKQKNRRQESKDKQDRRGSEANPMTPQEAIQLALTRSQSAKAPDIPPPAPPPAKKEPKKKKTKPQPPPPPQPEEDDDESEPDYYGLNEPKPSHTTPKNPAHKAQQRGSQESALSPEEAIKLVLKMGAKQSSGGGSSRVSEGEEESEEEEEYRHEVQDDDSQEEPEHYGDEEDSDDEFASEKYSKGRLTEDTIEMVTGGGNKKKYNKQGSNTGSGNSNNKWKKSKAKKVKENGNNKEWGNMSELSFATTQTQQRNNEDSDDDDDYDDFHDALQELDGESVGQTPTNRKASTSNLPDVREEDKEEDDDDDQRTDIPTDSGADATGWGRRISSMAFSVGTSVFTVATTAATAVGKGGEEKKSGDEEEGGVSGKGASSASSPTSMFGSMTTAFTSATTGASSLFTSVGNAVSGAPGDGEGEGGDDDGTGGGFFRKKPKNPPKKTAAPSRELEIIRKCQEQMKLLEKSEEQRRREALAVDAENIRLQKAELEAREIVQAEVERYRQTMIDMGKEDKLAKLGKSAAEEYDDRLALEDTLKEQEAKAALMAENMAAIDSGKKKEKVKDKYLDGDDDGSQLSDDDSEAGGGCCACIKKLICYGMCLILLAVIAAVPLYFFTDYLQEVPYLNEILPEWKGGDDDISNNTTMTPTMFPSMNSTVSLTAPPSPAAMEPTASSPSTPAPTTLPTVAPVSPSPTFAPVTNSDTSPPTSVPVGFAEPPRRLRANRK